MNRIYVLMSISLLVSLLLLVFSCQSKVSIETAQYAVNGQRLYAAHCQNCHGAKGEGLGKLYPPLTDSLYLNKHRDQLACIVKKGISGPIEIAGETYDGQMPGIPELTDIDIAYILTYITTTFGNSNCTYTQEEVKNSLKKCF